MTDLGQLLRKARLDKKISLDDLQEVTKIRKRYLEAIEEGNYKVLPGNFYVRAFIKSYAEAVDLDPNEVVNMYQNVIPQAEPEPSEPAIRTKRTGALRNTERIGKWASNIMVISFIVLILGIIYYFMSINYKGTSDASEDLPKKITDKIEPSGQLTASGATYQATPGGETQTPPVQLPAPPPPQNEVKLAKSERGIDYYEVSGVDKLKIEVTVTGDQCWMKIDALSASREQLFEGLLKNGETKSWELADSAALRFGKASAVEITINGQTFPVGDQANVKNLQVDLQKSQG
ncbi:helix-turn-helix domain-containing protein [Paenibacillus puerhi]|uniref:helix-turn-helix domain-containing protein n=1 Tax=Paenibacillus puerhi TaxID=2692622 RepID=UPI00135B4FEC|nr:helix-turn-helix domain-containing protein [Paenibacillus puerhi]